MRGRFVLPSVWGLVGAFALAAVASAQQQPPPLPPPIPRGEAPQATQPARAGQPAAASAAAPAAGEGNKQARELLTAALAKYRAAKTYQDKMTLRLEFKGTSRAGKPINTDEELDTATLRFAAPNRVALVTSAYALYADGKKTWFYNDDLKQYVVRPAAERFDYEKARTEIGAADPPHPVLYALHFPGKGFPELFPNVRGFSDAKKEERNGRPGWRLTGTVDPKGTSLAPEGVNVEGALLPLGLWLDEQTGLVGEIRIDLTEAYRRDLAAAPRDKNADAADAPNEVKEVKSAIATMRLEDVKLDAEIPAEQFTYDPPADAQEMKELKSGARPATPHDLIGKSAPVVDGTAYDGKPISLAELKGRVVVLDFWATWCVPCVGALPGMQKLHEKYTSGNKPVTFVGVDQDETKAEAKARKLIDEKKLTFRQLPDRDKKIGRSFNIATIPCAVIIDGQGRVQTVHLGATEKLHQELAEQIDKVLAGDSLIPPAWLQRVTRPIRTTLKPVPAS